MSTVTPSIALTPQSDLPETPRSLWSDAWRKLSHRPSSMICLAIVALYVIIALSTFLPIFDRKITNSISDAYHPPSLAKFGLWLGTDIQGFPVIWRLLYGTRIALLITIFASILSLGIGVTLGIIAGYFGGWIDEIITWLFTTVSSIPWVLLMIAMVYALKQREFPWFTIQNYQVHFIWTELDPVVLIILALGLTDWVGICRLIRGEVLKHRDRWKTTSWLTSGAIAGTVCIALAPLPTTPTRWPVRSTSEGHSAVWNAGPVNESRPSMSGIVGGLKMPTPLTTMLKVLCSGEP
jgi:ABC-type dipeptide/oligopeptide/nickel transport system permease subunit